MSARCLIIVVINYDMISCYHQDVKLKLIYIVIWKRIRDTTISCYSFTPLD